LKAEEEEITALTCGDLRFACGQPQPDERLSVEALDHRLQLTHQRINYGEQRLMELEILHLKRQVWEVAARQPAGRYLLPFVYFMHGVWYSQYGHHEESGRLAQEGMELLPEKDFMQYYVLYMVVYVAQGVAYRERNPAPMRGVELLRPWLTIHRWPHLAIWLYSVMGELLAYAGEADAALKVSTEACEMASDLPLREQARRAGSRAEMLLHSANRPAEALKALPPRMEDTPFHYAHLAVLHAEILAALKERSDARRQLDTAENLMKTYQIATLLPRIEDLQQQL
jgi:tetratricopeptide (TPR) repeat protein